MTDSVKITYFGISCFYIQYKNLNLLIDPGTKKIPDDIPVNYVFATHDHTDHIRALKKVVQTNPQALIIGNRQVISGLKKIPNETRIINDAESMSLENVVLKFLNCRHGIFKGSINTGINLILDNGITLGHVGDAVEYSGFRGEKFDALIVPISGIVTTSPKGAIKELLEFETLPKMVIPMHWVFRKPYGFCSKISKKFGTEIECKVLKKNQSLVI